MTIKKIPIEEMVDFFNGKTPPEDKRGEYSIYGSNGCIGHTRYYNHKNAIVIGRVGAYCGSVQVSKKEFWASDNTIVAKPKDGVDLNYLFYRLSSFPLRNHAGGAAQPLLTQTNLRGIKIPVFTDVSKQSDISSVLSIYDDLIENNRRRIQLLEQAARLLYKEWFVHLRFPGHEHVRIKDGIPEGWERKPLGQIAPLKYGKGLKQADRVPGPFPVYGSSGAVATHNKALVKGPTIIIGRKGTIGSVYWSAKDCHPIDTVYYIASENCSLYLYHALQNTPFLSTDVAVPGLNRDFAHSRLILIPDQVIQRLFEDSVRPMYQQVETLHKQNKLLGKARDLLLPRLMNGEISV